MLRDLAQHLISRPSEPVPPMLARRVLAAVGALDAGAELAEVFPEFTRCGRRDEALRKFAALAAPGLAPWDQAHRVLLAVDRLRPAMLAIERGERGPRGDLEIALVALRRYGPILSSQWRIARVLAHAPA